MIRRYHTSIALSGIAASVATALITPSALADDAQLERIIVSAQKTEQSIQEIPVAVTALSGDDLAETVSLDMFDIQNFVPGFAAFQSQSATNSSFSVRGIGTSSQNFGFESSVGMYVDGVYRSRQNALVNDLADMARVEILRGPQGTLFGKNTPAGAISIITRQPEHGQRDGYAELTLGNDNLVRVSAGATVTAIEDVLSFRASGFSTHRDGFIDDDQNQQSLNNRNRSGVRLQARYTPTDAVSLRVIADYSELDERCCGALTWQDNHQAIAVDGKFGTDALLMQPPFNASLFTRDDFFDYTTALSVPPVSKMTDKGLSAQLDVRLNDQWSVTSITAFRALDSYDSVDTDFSNASLLTATNDADQQAFSQELQLHYRNATLSGIFGAYWFSQNLNLQFDTTTQAQFPAFFAASTQALSPLLDGINTLSALTGGLLAPVASPAPADTAFAHTAYQEQDSIALFAQTQWHITPALTLTTGLRYTREEKSLLGHYTEQGPGIDGLPQSPSLWPDPFAAGSALNALAVALGSGQPLPGDALGAIAPFQQPGWGFFLLQSAAVLPRPDMQASLDDDQVTGTVKLSYQSDADTLWYASFATGFKAGGINTDRILPSLDPVFDAETARTLEFGLKRDWRDLNLRTNVAIYTTNVNDFQASTFTGTGFNLQNAGSISVDGLEIEMTWFPLENTQLTLAGARTLARFDRFEKGPCWVSTPWHTGVDDPGRQAPDLPYCSRGGDRVGFEPDNTLNLTLSQFIRLGDIDSTLSVDYQYVGDLYIDDSNDPLKKVSSHTLMNVRWLFTLPGGETDLIIWGRNVFDEDYVARSGFDVPVQTGKIMAYPGQPASYGISLRHHF
ncbi:TonB-dependent receptor [Alteromonas sp. CYL-A6]|uniref:TonB-dependent receptor n=1 Tax=Alteromonas nitratireducens TaxID=3390813 RepID=UPI0034BF04A2